MGWSESLQGSCKKHPSLNRSPGVCSSCLRERLSLISDSNNKRIPTTGPAGRRSCSSGSFNSTGASPARGRLHQRNASEAMGSMAYLVAGGLNKSRSVAFAPKSFSHRYVNYEADYNKNKKNNNNDIVEKEKKIGFWSKLIYGASGKRKSHVVKHRTTFRESLEIKI